MPKSTRLQGSHCFHERSYYVDFWPLTLGGAAWEAKKVFLESPFLLLSYFAVWYGGGNQFFSCTSARGCSSGPFSMIKISYRATFATPLSSTQLSMDSPINRSRAYSAILRDDWVLQVGLDQLFRLHISPGLDAGMLLRCHSRRGAKAKTTNTQSFKMMNWKLYHYTHLPSNDELKIVSLHSSSFKWWIENCIITLIFPSNDELKIVSLHSSSTNDFLTGLGSDLVKIDSNIFSGFWSWRVIVCLLVVFRAMLEWERTPFVFFTSQVEELRQQMAFNVPRLVFTADRLISRRRVDELFRIRNVTCLHYITLSLALKGYS